MEQRTEQWRQARRGLLTASNVGAALGLDPWRTPDDLIRQMAREWHGAEPEFTGNIATEYGTLNEPVAKMEYTFSTLEKVEDCGFFVCEEHPWLGASPDALVGEHGLVEIKCPFGKRSATSWEEFKPLNEQLHYFAQVQIQMLCAKRRWCDFYQWAKGANNTSYVVRNDEYLAETIPKLRAFYERYLSERDNPVHLLPKHADISEQARTIIAQYDAASAEIDRLTSLKKELLEKLVELADGKNAVIDGRKLTLVEKEGAISYAKALKDLAPNADLEAYRGKPSAYWKLS